MNVQIKNLENAIDNSIEIYEQNVDLLKTFRTKWNQDRDIAFIADNCQTLRVNDKLIDLYRSIFETTAMTIKSGNDCAGASVEVEGMDHVSPGDSPAVSDAEEKHRPNSDTRSTQFYIEEHVDLTEQAVSFKDAVTVVHFQNEMDESSSISSTEESCESSPAENSSEYEVDIVDEKYSPSTCGRSLHAKEFVDLANQHVSFNEAVTVVRFSNDMHEMTTVEPLPTPSTDEASSKPSTGGTAESDPKQKRTPKLFGSALRKAKRMKKIENLKKKKSISTFSAEPNTLSSVASERSQLGSQRNWKRRTGLCILCDQRNSFSRLQWQLHLLTHTKENFYFCKQCGRTFSKRHQHNTCQSTLTTDIYEQYNCVGEDYLAAFVCNICDYVRVSERRMSKHLSIKHNVKGNCKQFYAKCNLVISA
ncbi:uncharacterized protein LOC119084344 [Bradysia coprophila]|uniref:uncharacterized protein LOC119084344 n=1 Tax=Bradysia coprophila TaxID=38358 RepID=UPI00187DAE15|nr:uncharacterized protein LOC119084344 [Bradysia coprophila]